MGDTLDPLVDYYHSRAVQARIHEYCGGHGRDRESFSACGLAGYGGRLGHHASDGAPVKVAGGGWRRLLDEGADVCRALADRRGTLLHLDVDYCTVGDPGQAYRDPVACFERLEPVHEAVLEAFDRRGVHPFVLMTGRGYHYTARAVGNGTLLRSLLEVGNLEESLRERYAREAPGGPAAESMGLAHEGAGRLMEELAHAVVGTLRGRTAVPVTLMDAPPPGAGAFICLDLSPYADPLFERYVRCAFSTHQKVALAGRASDRRVFICLPRAGPLTDELLETRLDPTRAARFAIRTHASIPDVEGGEAWLSLYRKSPLAEFHRDFDHGPWQPRGAWPFTYDTLGPDWLPPCLATPLARPNPLLLRPVHLRSVALGLWGLGWHPRSAAAVVRSRYEQDAEWGNYWTRYHAPSRASFYVRLSCGAMVDRLEDPEDFTCASQQARNACDEERCDPDKRRLFCGLSALMARRLEDRARATFEPPPPAPTPTSSLGGSSSPGNTS